MKGIEEVNEVWLYEMAKGELDKEQLEYVRKWERNDWLYPQQIKGCIWNFDSQRASWEWSIWSFYKEDEIKEYYENKAIVENNDIELIINKNKSYIIPMEIAIANDRIKIVEILLEAGRNPNFAPDGHLELLELTARKVDSDLFYKKEYSKSGITCYIFFEDMLDVAIFYDNIDAAKLLIEFGADVNKKETFRRAVTLNRLEIVKLLLEKGADPNMKLRDNMYEYSWDYAIETATYHGYMDIVKLLIEYKANVKVNYEAPIGNARLRGDSYMADILIKAGANPNVISTRQKERIKDAIEVVKRKYYRGTTMSIASGKLCESRATPYIGELLGIYYVPISKPYYDLLC